MPQIWHILLKVCVPDHIPVSLNTENLSQGTFPIHSSSWSLLLLTVNARPAHASVRRISFPCTKGVAPDPMSFSPRHCFPLVFCLVLRHVTGPPVLEGVCFLGLCSVRLLEHQNGSDFWEARKKLGVWLCKSAKNKQTQNLVWNQQFSKSVYFGDCSEWVNAEPAFLCLYFWNKAGARSTNSSHHASDLALRRRVLVFCPVVTNLVGIDERILKGEPARSSSWKDTVEFNSCVICASSQSNPQKFIARSLRSVSPVVRLKVAQLKYLHKTSGK